MKTINTLIGGVLLGSLLLGSFTLSAQQKATTSGRQEFRVKVNSEIDGTKISVDTSFKTRKAMDAYLQKNNIQTVDFLPPAPPSPPAIPAAPRPPLPPSPPTPKPPLPDVNPGKGKTPRVVLLDEILEQMELPEITSENTSSEENCISTLKMEIEAQQRIIDRANHRIEVLNSEIGKCKSSSDIYLLPSQNITNNSIESVSDLSLSPNPNRGHFDIRFKVEKPADVKLKLVDVQGREIYGEVLSGFSGNFSKSVNLAKDSSGFYLLEITSGSLKQVLRVMVQ